MIFDAFIRNPAPDNWDGFSELMVQLGFVMDAEKSFEEYAAGCGIHMKHAATKREQRRNNLYLLEHADRQIVGNYLFSHWRYLTHWAGPYDQYDVDYLHRIIAILETKI